ncbi:MAG: hypothetical protein CVV64_18045 [Candidatus Wallbacteria bacterium HGW-Wallbacteria-1]|jgi:biopolymer transport protein ExbB|uniref:MotA/TolQ/ExbB proton channel domain-containing protein n=1 Tax=Candidatus Wallbacteria bacterium HGW-Wallbacteria-1 TaxID=2013854 RepID=A0A2N1PJT7_9BACT|nr:MAG: hypothetical protein CVV64_18045 [Candidatus Wallbacteria bacterium HGW-Wallbacteria-1]
MFELISKGGILMVPLIVCSIIAVAIFIERFQNLKRTRIDSRKFMEQLREDLGKGNANLAIFTCEKTKGPLANVLLAGLKASHLGKVEMESAMKEAGFEEIPAIEKHVSILATIANISPLLGLLGTVTGMIRAFSVIQQKGIGQAAELAGGISQALITTATGLTIAIPALVMYNMISSKIDAQISEIERCSLELINILYHSEDSQGYRDRVASGRKA